MTGRRAAASERISGAAETLLGLTLIAVVLVNVLNATARYLFSRAPTGADELMVYLLIAVVMAGSVLALVRRRHIAVNLLSQSLDAHRLRWLHLAHDILTLLVTGVAAYASWQFVARIGALGVRSMTLGIPMAIPHAVVFAGLAAMALVAASGVWQALHR